MKKSTILAATIFFFILVRVSALENTYYSVEAKKIYVLDDNNISELRELGSQYLEINNNVCHIKVPIEIKGTLRFTNNSCDVVKLYPGTSIKNLGELYFENVKVSSYDPSTGNPITLSRETYSKIRPHIVSLAPARYFSAKNSEFSHLGYYDSTVPGSAWGLSFYNMPARSGQPSVEIVNSRIHDNYFGVYTFNTVYVRIIDSEIYDNVEYGLDFHDYSDNHVILGNEIYRNGNHALIYSKFCENNLIKGNIIRDNNHLAFVKGEEKDYGTHGIMLDHYSNNNIIEGNNLSNNLGGIYLESSSENVVRDNFIIDDNQDGIYLSESHNNEISSNEVISPLRYGLYSYFSTGNVYSGNNFEKGVYVKGEIDERKFSIFYDNNEFDEEIINTMVEQELNSETGTSLNFLGIQDRDILSKVFFAVGLFVVVFIIIIVESILVVIRRAQIKNGKRI